MTASDRVPDRAKAYANGIHVLKELCDQGCGQRVEYWNDESGGNASCGCCSEGPEACNWIFPEQGDEIISYEGVQVAKSRGVP